MHAIEKASSNMELMILGLVGWLKNKVQGLWQAE